MSARLVTKKDDKIIPMHDLKPGVLAEIVGDVRYAGWVVQKQQIYDGYLVIGKSKSFSADCELKVRILDDGELIEVNQ